MLKVRYRYTKLEADKSAAVSEQVENDHEEKDEDLPDTEAKSSINPLEQMSETTEAEGMATDRREPSCRNSRRRQVTVHDD